jgi:hypothetical protein
MPKKQKEPAAFKRWRNFLKKAGKKGYTRDELVDMYHKKYPKKSRRTARRGTKVSKRKTAHRRHRKRKRRGRRGGGYDTDTDTTTESECD